MAIVLALPALLAGCSTLSDLDPVSWWHDTEGGPIADARPPPPNADAPYPSLGSVPDRPTGNDAGQRAQIANALVADRANAQYDAGLAPLPAQGSGPGRIAPVPSAPGDADTSSASLPAASAPPPPAAPPAALAAAPPRRAPVAPVASAPLPPPASAAAGPPASAAPPGGTAASAEAGTGTALPTLPERPPPPPALPGVAQATAPTPPVPAPPAAPPPPPVPVAGAANPIGFPPGSARLPSSALPTLKALALGRGGGSIAVTGFGEAAGTAPEQQAAAMPLALARARAIVAYLELAGVPASAIRIDAEAAGTGGAARLIR